jgi:hypothetical protein
MNDSKVSTQNKKINYAHFKSTLACFYCWFVGWQASHDESP